jgi:hypothetical protein
MRRAFALIPALIALSAGAVGAEATPGPLQARPVLVLRGCASPAKWHGIQRQNYTSNCQTCRIFGWRQVAREYHIRSRDPVIIARRYAEKAYRPVYRQAVFEGCLRGFRLRGRP